MGETQEFQNLRLRIMAEVNDKVGDVNKQFDEIISGLDKEGTEFSRSLRVEIEAMKKDAKKEIENVWSYLRSKLVSIEAGQKMLYDPKDGIMTKILDKADMAVKMSRDSAKCTAACLKSVENTQKHIDKQDEKHKEEIGVYQTFVKDSRLYMLIFIVSIAAASLAGIGLGVAKLIQDHNNQVQTVSYLDSLNQGVKIEGIVKKMNGMSSKKRKALLSQIKKK